MLFATKQNKQKRLYICYYLQIYNLATPKLKKTLINHWAINQQQPKLKHIFNQPPTVSYRKEKSLKDILVRAKIPPISQQS